MTDQTFDLLSWRKSLGWRQDEAAKALGVSRVTYGFWERQGIPEERAKLVPLACAELTRKHARPAAE